MWRVKGLNKWNQGKVTKISQDERRDSVGVILL